MKNQHKALLILLSCIIGGFILAGLISGGSAAIRGFILIQVHPAKLINDFVGVGGTGGALLNAGIVGLIGLILLTINGIQLSGPTYAAILTMMGFGLFGKTPVNILPIIAGVWLSARYLGKAFREYILIALFGTALGPLVSVIAFELGYPPALSLAFSAVAGLGTGFLLPALAVAMLQFHQGYNLYNLGMTCGFFGIFAASVIRAGGHSIENTHIWHTTPEPLLILLVPVLSLSLIITGIVSGKKRAFQDLAAIQKLPGRLPSDFMDMTDPEAALINSGLVGLAGVLYVWAVGGDFNGPVLGGLLTIIGFGAFGTHLKNSWPPVLGVVAASLLFRQPLNAPGPILAAIFCTTLGPLAGQFGAVTGIIAGVIHLTLVLQTGPWHGGVNLYNNGFAGGLTATLIVAVIQWHKNNKLNSR